MKASTRRSALAVAMALVASCTMKDQEAPPLTGPSEFGTSVTIQVTPDVLQQDGASQSVVSVLVRNAQGQPVSGVPLRAEIRVNGQPVDFGTLSARSIVTNSEGRAVLIYTAPSVIASTESIVQVAVTPIGTNFGDATTRNATIRLVPVGTVQPPSGLNPAFTFTPAAPTLNQNVTFDASGSSGPTPNSIIQYLWDFGDGATGTGPRTTHAFGSPGTHTVRLTISDSLGRSASTTQLVTVGQGTRPTASFTISPTAPVAGSPVRFNASSSTAAVGRTIVAWEWDFGDGNSGSGEQVEHIYTAPGSYTVTLVVIDDLGNRSVTPGKAVTIS
jgi:PKD repeat protein